MAASSCNRDYEEDWEPEVSSSSSSISSSALTPKESPSNNGIIRGRGRARGIIQTENKTQSRGRGHKKDPYGGTVVLKYKLEPVRPVPTLTLTDEQKSILIKKKQTFNDIKLIQQICGTSNLSPFKHILEFKRKQQHANTRVYPLSGHEEYKTKIDSSKFKSYWKSQNSSVQNIDDKSVYWIDTTEKYWFAHRILSKQAVLYMDTEGNSWDAYAGFICLIQVSTAQDNFIFDSIQIPQLIEVKMKLLLENPCILKVFHGCSQDIRWFQRDFGILVFPVLDTQLLPAPVGPEPGKIDSFATLVNKVLGFSISKEEKTLGQLSDYRVRPLHPNLQAYAMDDSRLLFHIFERVKNSIDLVEAFESTKKILNDSIYNGVKDSPNPSQNFSTIAKLKLWREEKSKSLDIKPQSLVSDSVLLNAAAGKIQVKKELLTEVSRVVKGEEVSKLSKGTPFCFRCGNSGCIAVSCTNEKLPKSEITKRYYAMYPEKEKQEKERKKIKKRVKLNAIAAGSYHK